MKGKLAGLLLAPVLMAVGVLIPAPSSARAQGTAFTYQGLLNAGGSPANGCYDFRFRLATDPAGDNLVGETILTNALFVTNGMFGAILDFGPGVFTGTNYWLKLDVRANNNTLAYTDLAPLEELTPTPYAIMANVASNVLGPLPAANLTGVIPLAQLPTGLLTNNASAAILAGAFTGSGANLTNLNASALNAGTIPNGVLSGFQSPYNFLGGGRYNELDSTANGCVIGGGFVNYADGTNATVGGGYGNAANRQNATVGGGNNNAANGQNATVGGGGANTANADYATVSGGVYNSANAAGSFIGGGGYDGASKAGNTVSAPAAGIVGGVGNRIAAASPYSFIGGGAGNVVTASGSFIVGGGYDSDRVAGNTVNAPAAGIAGGYANQIGTGSPYSFIGGGFLNLCEGDAFGQGTLVIVGGDHNTINSNSWNSVIVGGEMNTVAANSDDAFVGGGSGNNVGGPYATVSGGNLNHASGGYATVSGGDGNNAGGGWTTVSGGDANQAASPYSFIGGGAYNTANGDDQGFGALVIGGGAYNVIESNSWNSVIVGGERNTVATESDHAFVGGGLGNSSGAPYAMVAGGQANKANGRWSAVPGGCNNVASGANSFAAGANAKAGSDGSFVWCDLSLIGLSDAGPCTFSARATNGFYFWTTASSENIGAQLLPGATSWTALSDRNAKKNIEPVDCAGVLDKLDSVPVSQWRYKWEKDSEAPHLGPMAQDFKHAFYPGRDDTGITTLEFDGGRTGRHPGLEPEVERKRRPNPGAGRQGRPRGRARSTLARAGERGPRPRGKELKPAPYAGQCGCLGCSSTWCVGPGGTTTTLTRRRRRPVCPFPFYPPKKSPSSSSKSRIDK
jgi:hypothetical protein